MATRRPQSSRARNPPTQPPMPRSRSVLAKPAASTRCGDDSTTNSTFTKPPKGSHTPSQSQSQDGTSEAESNIQVVIRCRRRSEREVGQNSPVIVTSNGAKSNQVSIETTAPTSTLGLVTLPPVRTYPFDLVFGPEADQALIYHEVVNPMLEQVLMGYNCTLFAYGQTGTGKTYTMHGDLTPTPMGNPSVHAGMIPRVLFRLFHYLETSAADFSVKVSYIELYNEELRDLLATDLAAPAGTSQPMGKGTSRNDDGGLKIFDDSNKRGVYIQGVEEVPVKDSVDALALLTKGSLRRQTAATKFNDHSSRSHSIFSITIHTKETGLVSEDLLKTGKLNLVDLAGSENIGRSGAQNTRAREAGMINQSLLTLGRVINALVEKAQHVPYRESKLTRLLQDSLGGRTKTCIVATVSPARCNVEETLSTLDYAMHAKSIRNKPELNQRMTRNSLLKEYIAEIERLKADVLAAREKNGIFFSEETWNQISAEQELQKTELNEAKKQVDIVESTLRAVRDEFDQSIGMLKKREGELKETRERLEETEGDLLEKNAELGAVKKAFEEEVVFRKAFEHTEGVLDGVAGALKTVASEGLDDVDALFDKLERKADVMASNSKVVATHSKTVSSATRLLSRQLDELVKASLTNTTKLGQEAEEFASAELSALASYSKRLHSHIKQLKEALSVIASQNKSEEDALDVVKCMLKETHETFKDGFGTWGATLSATCSQLCAKAEGTGLGAFADAEKVLKVMSQVVESVLRDAFKFIEGERQAIISIKAIAADAANQEIKRLKQQNQKLVQMVEAEKAKADKAKADLVQRISGMLGTFVTERDAALREQVKHIQHDNEGGEKTMKEFVSNHEEALESMESEGMAISANMEKKNGDVKRTRDGAFKSLTSAKGSLKSELANLEKSVSGSITTYSHDIQGQAVKMNDSCSSNFEQHHRAKRIRLDVTENLGSQVNTQYQVLDDAITSTSSNIKAFVSKTSSIGSTVSGAIKQFEESASSEIASIGGSTKSLAIDGAKLDVPTGSTPRKKTWNYVDEWELTDSREAILKAWRIKGLSEVGNETFTAEHLPLPDDEESVETQSPSLRSTLTSQPSPPKSPPPPSRPPSKFAVKTKGKGPAVSLDPLVDARNVYMTRGARRR